MATKIDVTYDKVSDRWKATCPHCGRIVARSKREAAEHAMTVHRIYEHEEQL